MSDLIVADFEKKLKELPDIPSTPPIDKIDIHVLNSEWDNNYHPEIISIGPYHHRNSRLQNMEKHKYRYLKQLLERKNEKSMDKYVTAAAKMEERARECYSEPIDLDSDEFVTMMVLDGCFLVELFRYFGSRNLRDTNDPIFRQEKILSHLLHDILLLENQLPFFVLNQLFIMTKSDGDPKDGLSSLVFEFCNGVFLNSSFSKGVDRLKDKNIDHILSLIYDAWCLPFANTIQHRINVGKNKDIDQCDTINSISRLLESGIKFEKKNQSSGSMMDIDFVNGVLRIPKLKILDGTESQFRNLIAYEQFLPAEQPRFASDYAFFMHCLLKNSNDVELLRGRAIIENWFGDDKEVCLMFNRLRKNVRRSSNSCYSQIFRNVNKYCLRGWKANFKYPWCNCMEPLYGTW